MAPLQFDDQDKRAFAKLDSDFTIDNETATVSGEMTVEIVRLADDQFQLKFQFPGGEQLDVKILRAQLLQQLHIGVDRITVCPPFDDDGEVTS